jgi:hypothetical protein
VDKTNAEVRTNDRAPTLNIRLLALTALLCERLMTDPSTEAEIREQAARLYDQWVCFVRHDRWFSEAMRSPYLSAGGVTLMERMESFLHALVDRPREAGGAESQRCGKDSTRPEDRFIGRAVSLIEKKGRRALLAMAARIGGKSG